MTKRLYTAEKVLEAVLEDLDDDQDYDDPNEPVMEGSDDEFSDLELDDDDADVDLPPPSPLLLSPSTPGPVSPPSRPSTPGTSPCSSTPNSPPPPAQWTSTLKPVEVKPFTSPVGPATAIPESPREVFEMFFSDDLMQLMVTESNRYAEEVMGSEKFATWTKITEGLSGVLDPHGSQPVTCSQGLLEEE